MSGRRIGTADQGAPTKVLLADPSESVRVILSDILSGCAEIRVIAEAASGRDAVGLTLLLKPDVVILDPGLELCAGKSVVQEIMTQAPTPLLLLTQARNEIIPAIRQWLDPGALQVMERPLLPDATIWRQFGPALIEKVLLLALSGRPVTRQLRTSPAPGPIPRYKDSARNKPAILAIGASTGGPRAVMSLMKALPCPLGATILIVQHIADGRAAGFAHWLDRGCAFKVRLAEEGDLLGVPGQALVAPDGCHMTMRKGRIKLLSGAPVNHCCPSIDVLFDSMAQEPCELVGVLLTGMGKDGAQGLLRIKEQGGFTIAQDEGSCAIFGMPKAAIHLGAAREVLSIGQMATRISQLFQQSQK